MDLSVCNKCNQCSGGIQEANMPNRCAVFGCRGNYPNEPYSSMVKFPDDPTERQRWIESMPNEKKSLMSKKVIHVCASHFDCDWITVFGGKRPSNPPSVFKNVPSSCLKQVNSAPRSTKNCLSHQRADNELNLKRDKNKNVDFNNLALEIYAKKFRSRQLKMVMKLIFFLLEKNG